MAIPALTNAWLLVEEMPRAVGFYRDTLGLEIADDFGQYVELNTGESFKLSLFERRAMQAGEPGIAISPVSGQHGVLTFQVESVDAFCEGLRAKGVEFVSGEADHEMWGLRTAFLYDPDGNLVCLYSRIPMGEE